MAEHTVKEIKTKDGNPVLVEVARRDANGRDLTTIATGDKTVHIVSETKTSNDNKGVLYKKILRFSKTTDASDNWSQVMITGSVGGFSSQRKQMVAILVGNRGGVNGKTLTYGLPSDDGKKMLGLKSYETLQKYDGPNTEASGMFGLFIKGDTLWIAYGPYLVIDLKVNDCGDGQCEWLFNAEAETDVAPGTPDWDAGSGYTDTESPSEIITQNDIYGKHLIKSPSDNRACWSKIVDFTIGETNTWDHATAILKISSKNILNGILTFVFNLKGTTSLSDAWINICAAGSFKNELGIKFYYNENTHKISGFAHIFDYETFRIARLSNEGRFDIIEEPIIIDSIPDDVGTELDVFYTGKQAYLDILNGKSFRQTDKDYIELVTQNSTFGVKGNSGGIYDLDNYFPKTGGTLDGSISFKFNDVSIMHDDGWYNHLKFRTDERGISIEDYSVENSWSHIFFGQDSFPYTSDRNVASEEWISENFVKKGETNDGNIIIDGTVYADTFRQLNSEKPYFEFGLADGSKTFGLTGSAGRIYTLPNDDNNVASQKYVKDSLAKTAISPTKLSNVDLNTLNSSSHIGIYYASGGNGCTNLPSDINQSNPFGLMVIRSADGWLTQILYNPDPLKRTYFRNVSSTAQSEWKTVTTRDDLDGIASEDWVKDYVTTHPAGELTKKAAFRLKAADSFSPSPVAWFSKMRYELKGILPGSRPICIHC